MKKLLLRLGDYLFVMRPLILVPAWSFYLLGSAAGRRAAGVTPAWFDWSPGAPPPFYFGFACLTAVLVSAYLLNQIFDQESDRLNGKGHFLTRGIFTAKTVLVMAVTAFLVASFLFRYVAESQREVLVLAVVISLAYSAPPLRLVARPFVDLLANAVGYGGIAYMAGFAAWNPRLEHAVLLSIPYVFLVGAVFLHTTLLDAAGDRQSGKKTTTVVIGEDRSVSLSCVLVMAGLGPAFAISFLRFHDWLAPLLLGLCAVILVHAALKSNRTESTGPSSQAVQLITLVVTVPAAATWPAYVVLLLPVILAARLYYTVRFGITYPGPGRPAKDASTGASGPPLN
jgi:chlorophyll synthase